MKGMQEEWLQPMKNLKDAQIGIYPRRNPLREFVEEAATRYDPDPEHNKRVTSFAMVLFDGLRPMHGYGYGERGLLQVAARLHDIGKHRAVSGDHHKLSRDMILEFDIPGFTEQDRLACSLIARYHTKALPNPSRHRQFASLDYDRQQIVEWLAGILRVADGLDCSHFGTIDRVKCGIGPGAIHLWLDTAGDCRRQIERARQKGELLVHKAGRPIQYLYGLGPFRRHSEDRPYASFRNTRGPLRSLSLQ